MSAWRREALACLPEYQRIIAKAPNPMAMWIDFEFEFARLYQEAKTSGQLNDDRVGRFYKYAKWCIDTAEKAQSPTEVSSAAACAFFEHIILIERVRDDMHRWIGPTLLDALAGPFTCHFPADEFAVFRAEFLRRWNAVKPSSRPATKCSE